MHALIVGSAPARDENGFYAGLLASTEYVIGADGGAVFAAASGRLPDAAVGDFDSSARQSVDALREAGARVVAHSPLKDETDLDLALQFAREQGATRVTLTAAFSDRLDHTLAALGTLLRAADLLGEVREPTFTAWTVGGARPKLRLEGEPGNILSLISPSGASGVSITGMRYPLDDAVLGPLSSLGVSNVLERGTAEITVRNGIAIVIAEGERLPPTVGVAD